MMLAKFRQLYPQGSLVGELIDIDRGTYIVKVSAIVNNITLATGLAGRDTVETAEDAARERAISALMLDRQNSTPINKSTRENKNNKTVADFAPKKELESVSISPHPQDKLEYETPAEIIPEPGNKPQQPSSDTSTNLFAGTFNPETIPENFSEPEKDNSVTTSSANVDKLTESDRLEEFNFSEIKHKTDLEIKRLGWTQHDGKEFLKSRYGKPSRLHLTDRQLLEFLQYLESQPNPS